MTRPQVWQVWQVPDLRRTALTYVSQYSLFDLRFCPTTSSRYRAQLWQVPGLPELAVRPATARRWPAW